MKITQSLLNQILDNLVMVCICANGGVPRDENDEIHFEPDQIEKMNTYARETLTDIMGPWEELTGEKWVVIPDKN